MSATIALQQANPSFTNLLRDFNQAHRHGFFPNKVKMKGILQQGFALTHSQPLNTSQEEYKFYKRAREILGIDTKTKAKDLARQAVEVVAGIRKQLASGQKLTLFQERDQKIKDLVHIADRVDNLLVSRSGKNNPFASFEAFQKHRSKILSLYQGIHSLTNSVSALKKETVPPEIDKKSSHVLVSNLKGFAMGAGLAAVKHAVNSFAFNVGRDEPPIQDAINGMCAFWRNIHLMINQSSRWYITQQEAWKASLGYVVVGGPVFEELIFRGLIQDVLLKRFAKKAIQAISPQHASWVDTRTAKVCRVILASGIFAAMHLVGAGSAPNPSVIYTQAKQVFFLGLVLGALRESRAGLAGSIAAHVGNNLSAMLLTKEYCID